METISLEHQKKCSIVSNPERLLQKLHLHPQWVYDDEWNVKYWEYLTRFNDIAGTIVAECFAVLEKKENSFNWYSTVVSKVIEKILNDDQLNPLSINTLPNDILDPNFINISLSLLEKAPENQSVILEIVEKSFWSQENTKIIYEKLVILQNSWIKIAIDDIHFTHPTIPDIFSQWKKNLEDLISYGLFPDVIKIDWKKMNTLFDNRNNPDFKVLIDTYKKWLNDFSQQILESGKKPIIVAEWVNTHEEIKFATSLWCNWFQGFDLKELFSN